MTHSAIRKSALCLVFALLALPAVSAARAEQNSARHAHKIQKKLARFPAGSYVDIDLRNGSESLGSLGALTDSTFQINDADNNKSETFAYSDVARVRGGRSYIGEGSENGRHRLHLIPIAITAAAAAAGIATYEALR